MNDKEWMVKEISFCNFGSRFVIVQQKNICLIY